MDPNWKETRKRKFEESSCDPAEEAVKPACKYGSKCYRKNPDHLAEYSHPSNQDEDDDNDVEEIAETSKKASKKNEEIKPKFYFTKIHDVPNAAQINKHNSLSLSDILAKDADQFIESVQFNYMFDLDWLTSQYPAKNRSKPLMIVDGGGNDLGSRSHVKHVSAKFDNIYGKHHSKMMFLLYKTGMRVVIHTANMIEIDWYQKTNGVWISDLFPRIDKANASTNLKTTDSKTNFKQYLIMYLDHYKKSELNAWIDHIKDHDMKTANVFLIASAPGRFPSTKRVYGLLRIQKLLEDHFKRDEQVSTEATSSTKSHSDRIVCQFSSIGSLGPNENSWLCGELKKCLSACKNAPNVSTSLPICIYPTIENVLTSFEGVMAGGSLPYGETTHNKQKYLENYLYKWKADSVLRSKAMPHIKTFARYSTDFTKCYWFLLTSANLSKAAWGKFEKNETQMFIMSYEIGVLFLPSFVSNDETKTYFDLKDKNEFIVPYDLPPVKYSQPKDKPWAI